MSLRILAATLALAGLSFGAQASAECEFLLMLTI